MYQGEQIAKERWWQGTGWHCASHYMVPRSTVPWCAATTPTQSGCLETMWLKAAFNKVGCILSFPLLSLFKLEAPVVQCFPAICFSFLPLKQKKNWIYLAFQKLPPVSRNQHCFQPRDFLQKSNCLLRWCHCYRTGTVTGQTIRLATLPWRDQGHLGHQTAFWTKGLFFWR